MLGLYTLVNYFFEKMFYLSSNFLPEKNIHQPVNTFSHSKKESTVNHLNSLGNIKMQGNKNLYLFSRFILFFFLIIFHQENYFFNF